MNKPEYVEVKCLVEKGVVRAGEMLVIKPVRVGMTFIDFYGDRRLNEPDWMAGMVAPVIVKEGDLK